MPRAHKWGVERLNTAKSSDSLEPIYAPVLTEGEIRLRRLELAAEMVELMLGEESLARKPRRELEGIYSKLRQFRSQL